MGEEPLPGAALLGWRCCARADGARIAGGEMARTFVALALQPDALDVYQPDAVLALGISGVRAMAEMALRRGRWFTPHTRANGIRLLANLHVCAGVVGGGPYLELP
jgi:D-galactarolactone cycloisomerase